MTSIAFIAGVFPLVVSHGAGAEMRQAMGIAVFSGMIGVTLFGLFLTPVFYVTLMKLGWKKKTAPEAKGLGLGSAGAAAGIVTVLLLFAAALRPRRLADRRPGLPAADQFRPRNITKPPNLAPGRKAGRWTTCRREIGGRFLTTPI